MCACGGSPTSSLAPPPPPPPNAVASVAIKQAPPGAIEAGSTVQLQAEARNAGGELVSNQLFTWSSSAPVVATVSALGRVTAVAPGTTTITVQSAGRTATATITVIPAAVLSVGVFPATLAIAPGGTGQFNASVLGNNGVIAGHPVTWSTSDPAVASVDNTGRVTAVAPGVALIRARAGGAETNRGVTVSAATLNFAIHHADFIQVSQTALGDVVMVRGKPSAVRIFPAASEPGWQGVWIETVIERDGVQLFRELRPSGLLPVTPSLSDPQQGVIVPLPPGLDIHGATLRVTIDPQGDHAERDEWDNFSVLPGNDGTPVNAITIPTLRIRLVPLAPAGTTPPNVDQSVATGIAAFMRTVYPATSIEVSIRSASIVTPFTWSDRNALSDALATVEIERLADGFDGHYYGLHDVGAVEGIVGLGYLTARSSLGTYNGEVFAHEVGHNMGLGHPPGCGAANPNAAYPYPNGQIGIRGYDPRTQATVPATAIDMMGYCGGTKWISGGYYSGILSVLRTRPPGTLRADPGDVVPITVRARWSPDGLEALHARVAPGAAGLAANAGPAVVEAVDADGTVLATARLPLLDVADAGVRHVLGVIAVPREVAPRVRALWVRVGGLVGVAAVER